MTLITYTPKKLTTEQFADLIQGKPSSIRTRLCKTGSFYGIVPTKLPSGRLLWDAVDVEKFINGES